uniref:Uncharacterized protein n=1 Tax=Arundo donax TaxID=35708 RepID=A0A0A8ZL57_ARUDO
MSCMWSPFWCK